MGVNLKLIKIINNFLLGKIKINFTFLNTVNKKNMQLRLFKRKKLNRYDRFNWKFYKKVQEGFLKMSKLKPSKYMKIDSNIDIIENKKIILNKIADLV